MQDLPTIAWHDGKVRILDQTQLPHELVMLEISDYPGVIQAIKSMAIRGAPAIGVAAAFAVVLSVWHEADSDRAGFLEKANKAINEIKQSRPTAKNLFWAVERMRETMAKNLNRPLHEIKIELLRMAQWILDDDVQRCKAIGKFGASLLPDRCAVLTHCNAGALATAGYGTALGVIRSAVEQGKKIQVYADETRPLLQGARLTAFELMEDNIPVTLICDNMAAALMRRGMVQLVLVGADRIAANGDTANKIGTYGLAVLAKHHKIPLYVAAPWSTIDMELNNGNLIPIEERSADEVRRFQARPIAPDDVPVWNPAFDVTPNNLIDIIITDRGVIRPPFNVNLAQMMKQ
jgi:methylthioribose-1-phosphate isomerase